ncbi:MAG: hypothetical protein HUU06_00305 [Planctomycetaceae bacterium]|nr:hypothetical protein [Planctomycetota bacterium]NUN51217.1 hypothetical protein [Planctomycetaceae bacterium]
MTPRELHLTLTAQSVRETRAAWWTAALAGAALVGKLPDLATVVARASGEEPPEQSLEEQLAAARGIAAAFAHLPVKE